MPKQPKNSVHPRFSPVSAAPLQRPMSATTQQQHHRVAAVWNSSDDETLLAARATGLNWQPIAIQHFPNKTANACRKRHERLMEKKRHEDWDSRKLDVLATAYMECRKEIWSIVAARIGEPWAIVEEKVRCIPRPWMTLAHFWYAVYGKGLHKPASCRTDRTKEHGTGQPRS